MAKWNQNRARVGAAIILRLVGNRTGLCKRGGFGAALGGAHASGKSHHILDCHHILSSGSCHFVCSNNHCLHHACDGDNRGVLHLSCGLHRKHRNEESARFLSRDV